MTWTLSDDVSAYREAVADLLGSEPERYSIFATILASLGRRGSDAFGGEPAVLGWWPAAAAPRSVRAAVLQTPPRELLVTSLPAESVVPLATALAEGDVRLPGINGTEKDAAAFAKAWSEITGQVFGVHERHRLHRLGDLAWPDPLPEGAGRVAEATDRATVWAFVDAFTDEVTQPRHPRDLTDDRLDAGQFMLWEVAGEPVSMAGVSDAVGGVARVGPVYTPPDRRGHGYGGGVTAAVTELALDRGARSVILYTDVANPTSNALYARLGYRPVEDRVILKFQ
jgi:RimJ/RimL family protein N-acetyltransferase